MYKYISTTMPLARLACGVNCSSALLEFRPESLHSSFGIPAGSRPSCWKSLRIPADSVRESDRFRQGLTESQLFQRRRHSGNPENVTLPKRNPLFCFQMSLNASLGISSQRQVWLPMGPRPAPKIRQQCNITSTA